MNSTWQTWAALVVVAVAAALLTWRWWRRRGKHEGCDCPGASASRDIERLKKKIHRG